jgi:5-formyltetrahydrofolate cyclo-ligase
MSTAELRQSIRRQRRALTPAAAASCARQLAHHARHDRLVTGSRHIAAYLAADGEMDPLPLMHALWSLGKHIYLPVLVTFSHQKLWFAKFEPGDEVAYNRYGIPEPVRRKLIKPCALDLVLAPLVAFDSAGHRVGMGGGYYDRSFAFLQQRSHWRKPRLLGIAYEFQQQPAIQAHAWDVPLDAIATEAGVYVAAATRGAEYNRA